LFETRFFLETFGRLLRITYPDGVLSACPASGFELRTSGFSKN